MTQRTRQGWGTPIFFDVGDFKYKGVPPAGGAAEVSRTTMSRVLNGRAGISADMSLRLSDALGTHAAFWSGMQMEYELWHASRKGRPKILPFHRAA